MYRQPRATYVLLHRIASDLSQAGRGLLIAKVFYFSFFAAVGCIAPFLNIYLQRQGINGAQLGWLNSVPPLIALVANPFWGSVADRWQIHRLVLAACALVAGLASLGFLWIHAFAPLMLLIILFAFFRTPIMALMDSTVMDLVKRSGGTYGRQRMWGSLGFVLTSFGLGQLLTLSNLRPVFWVHALLLSVVCVGLSRLLPIQGTGSRVDLMAGIRSLFARPGYLSFLGAMALVGAGMSSYVNFMALFMLQLGGNEAQVGLAWAINGAMEIPIMFFGARLIGRHSHSRMLLCGFLGFAIAWSLIGFASAPWQLLLLTGLHGLCFGTFWIAVVAYASEAAPPGLGATSQALVGAAQAGLGWAAGAIVAGYLWDLVGPRSVFTAGAGMALMAALLFFLGSRQRITPPTPAVDFIKTG